MAMSLSLGALRLDNGSAGSAAAPGIVSAFEVLGDISIAITSPSSQSVPMQTNGTAIRIATSGVAAHTALDLTKITLTVSDQGWDTSGNQVAKTRTIGIRAKLIGPYNETSTYQPNLGEFYLKLDDFIFNQDATWKTTITSLNLAAGWITAALSETVTSVTRSDSLTYFPFPHRIVTPPWKRVASGGTIKAQITVVHGYAQALSQVACVEAWAYDGVNTGTVARTSTYGRSVDTPNNATVKGGPVPLYELDVDPAGLTAGQCSIRCTVKPWIGPSVDSTTYGTAFPTLNPPQSIPFGYDTNGSHAPLYAVLSNEQATPPSGKTLIATNTNVATVSVIGVSTTMAGAIASGQVYADLGTLFTAIRRINKNAGPFTIAEPSTGAASFSYARTTVHDDLSGAVAVCQAISGSVLGADAGAYSIWQSLSTAASYPPGITAAEIRSEAGTPSDDVRWRGVHGDGSALSQTSRVLASRMRLRGLTFDSTGIATAANNTVVGGSASGTTALSEANAYYVERLDCITKNTTTVSPGASVVHRNFGYGWDIRCESHNDNSAGAFAPAASIYPAGLCSSIGSYYNVDSAILGGVEVTCLLGAKVRNIIFAAPIVSNRPRQVGRIFSHMEMTYTVSMTSAIISIGGSTTANTFPILGGEAYSVVHIWGTLSDSTSQPVSLTADGVLFEADNLIIQHLGSAWGHSAQTQMGRLNFAYNEQGYLRVNKRGRISYCAVRSWNNKGDTVNAPETSGSGPKSAHSGANAYFKGDMVTSGGHAYQAKQDVPGGSTVLISDTNYWYDGGVTGVAFGQQPLRQGNADLRYHVGCRGNVAENTASGAGQPGPTSFYGIAWGSDEKPEATYANFYNAAASDDYTPKSGGELVNRVASGFAVTPFDIAGKVLLNDGTDAAGPLQITGRSTAP